MKFGILGSGSWGTALAKILTDNGQTINWWLRNESSIQQFKSKSHNPNYLTAAKFNVNQLSFTSSIEELIQNSEIILIAVPSAYISDLLISLPKNIFKDKKILTAIKGILPQSNLLLNDFLSSEFEFSINNYFAVSGPCHAEEVAAEKLSYLTFAGVDEEMTNKIASNFKTPYLPDGRTAVRVASFL